MARHQDVQDAFYRLCHDFAGGEPKGGVPALARLMGMPPGTLYNKANHSDNSHHKPTLADAVLASVLSEDKRLVQAFCHTLGGVFVQSPDLSDLTTDALLNHLVAIERESGDFYRTLETSIKKDNRISVDEYKFIEREALEWIASIHETLIRLREMAGVAA